MPLTLNQLAPDFSLADQAGQLHQLSAYRGQWVLLYFYPKDDTPGCTTEACTLRDNLPQLGHFSAKVLGISTDSVKSHAKFATKYDLPFPLLADEQREVVELYQAWGPKKMYGKTYQGTYRLSYLINPAGYIVQVYDKVKPETHADEVLQDLARLGSSS